MKNTSNIKSGKLLMTAGLIAVAILMVFGGCTKEKEPIVNAPISEVPALKLLSASPSQLTALQDALVFEIEYTDGDGDLGFDEADSMSLFITDTRFPLTEAYAVQPLSPPNTTISIQGILRFTLDRTIMMDPNATSETVVFEIQLRDRAGHWSNVVSSPPILVTAN